MITILFNNIDLEPYFRIKDIRGRGLIQRKINGITVTGMPGEHLASIDDLSKYLEIDIRIVNQKLRETIDNLNEIFSTDEPVPIIFPDEPDKTYYGTVETSAESGEKLHLNRHDTTFLIRRSDPFKYGPEETETITDATIIENKGTAETEPIFTMDVLEPTTFAMVSNGEEYMMVGRPFDIDEIPTEQYPEVAFYPMETKIGWSYMTEGYLFDDEVSGGVVSNGSIEVRNGVSFSPSSFGTQQSGWYGPAIRRSLPESVGDFRITFGTSLYGDGKGVGKVMAILLDENDDIVASIGLINTRRGTRNVRVLARMNDGNNIRRTRVMDYPGDSGNESTVFSGRPLNIQLIREGNRFFARTFQTRDGLQHARHSEELILDVAEYQRPIRQVALYFAKHGSTPSLNMQSIGLGVQKNNTLQMGENMIPYIADTGDQIIFDHKTGDAYVNGEPVPFDFGADFFKLNKGENALAVMPENTFETSVKFRDRYR